MTKPKINRKFISFIENILNKGVNIEPEIAQLYAFCVEYNLVHRLYELGIFKSMSDEEVYRINLVVDDVEQEHGTQRLYQCRVPLFEFHIEENKTFDFFYRNLVTRPSLRPFISKLDRNEESKDAFEELMLKYPDFDVNKLVDSTEDYYRNEQYSKKLSNFLKENAEGVYLSYEKKKVNLI